MFLFLLLYLVIYGGLQGVFYLRIRELLPQVPFIRFGLLLLLSLMVLLPILTHILDEQGHHFWARLSAWIGFTWMGFVFLAFWISLLSFAIQALWPLIAGRGIYPGLSRYLAVSVPLLAAALMVYGAYESLRIRVEEVELRTQKLPEGVDSLRILLISDVHLGLLSGEKRVRAMARVFDEFGPDLILCTGDLVDGRVSDLHGVEAALREVSPPLGKYAVTGNHEMYIGREASLRFFEKCGFVVLSDQTLLLGKALKLAGREYGRQRQCSRDLPLLQEADPSRYTILLRHAPDICRESLGRFDLQLSGHTHKGQIFPFGVILRLVYPYTSGLHTLDKGSRIYVSRGTGTWGPQARILSPPEITVIRLKGS
ncbi:MAG: metallophosphoesterase [Desulfohalobiaceae bacterium]|nr:metallophosphoesterase [Desulfohalobiaceae bacterium]